MFLGACVCSMCHVSKTEREGGRERESSASITHNKRGQAPSERPHTKGRGNPPPRRGCWVHWRAPNLSLQRSSLCGLSAAAAKKGSPTTQQHNAGLLRRRRRRHHTTPPTTPTRTVIGGCRRPRHAPRAHPGWCRSAGFFGERENISYMSWLPKKAASHMIYQREGRARSCCPHLENAVWNHRQNVWRDGKPP